jgi:hypothetical protein
MLQKARRAHPLTQQFILLMVVLIGGLFLPLPAFAQEATASTPFDVEPFLNLLALALVIERLIEIGVTFFPGLEDKRIALEDNPDELAKLKLKITRLTMLIGMVMGVLACVIFKFGIIDEIFPGRISNQNLFNTTVTGIIAGAGADPVHQLVLILVSVRERLRSRARTK